MTREQLIADFEKKVGHPLPPDFRDHLLAGPHPKRDEESLADDPAAHIRNEIYDLGANDREDISRVWDERVEDIPDWFLEFAEVYDGVKIGVGLHGEHRGKVYSFSWDDCGEVSLDADSFSDFMKKLERDEKGHVEEE
jgi:hypothetical protein